MYIVICAHWFYKTSTVIQGEKNINLRSDKPKLSIRQVCRLNHNFAQQLKTEKKLLYRKKIKQKQ